MTTQQLIRVLMVDDHALYRDGLKQFIQKKKPVQVVGEASNGEEAIILAEELKPDVVIMDIEMPKMDGIKATKEITKNNPSIKVLCLSFMDCMHAVIDMMEAGAIGYVCKQKDVQEIDEAIQTVYAGKPYFSPSETETYFATKLGNSKSDMFRFVEQVEFSEREREIIKLTCEEKSSQEIGDVLHLSARTVETHRQNIYRKMNVNTAIGMFIYALKHNLYHLPSSYTRSKV